MPGLPQTSTAAGYSVSSATVTRHMARADALIDSMITRRYATPIVPTPPLLSSLAEDITVYFTYRSFYTQDNINRNEYFEELKNTALEMLKDIRDGKIDLVDSTGGIIEERTTDSTSGVLDSTTKDYQPFFDIDDEFKWKFDTDLIDDLASKR